MREKHVTSSGVPAIDALAGMEIIALADYIAAASAYVTSAGSLSQDEKKRGQIRLSSSLARITLTQLEERLPNLRYGRAGESDVSGALRTVKADVSEMHPLDGLRLAIELKPVLLAVGSAIWNRFGDIRTFAVNLHLKFPFGVVGAVMAVPIWEEMPNPRSGHKKSVTPLIDRLCTRLVRAGGRQTEGDAPHLLEGVAVLAFDPDSGSIHPHLPAEGSGLRWDEFIQTMGRAYEGRFEP